MSTHPPHELLLPDRCVLTLRSGEEKAVVTVPVVGDGILDDIILTHREELAKRTGKPVWVQAQHLLQPGEPNPYSDSHAQ